jgi:hypothetical protein
MNDHSDWEARPDCQWRLNVEVPSNDLLTSLIQRISCAKTESLNNICVIAAISTGARLGSDAKHGRQECGLEQFKPMIINFILQTRIAARIRSLLLQATLV